MKHCIYECSLDLLVISIFPGIFQPLLFSTCMLQHHVSESIVQIIKFVSGESVQDVEQAAVTVLTLRHGPRISPNVNGVTVPAFRDTRYGYGPYGRRLHGLRINPTPKRWCGTNPRKLVVQDDVQNYFAIKVHIMAYLFK